MGTSVSPYLGFVHGGRERGELGAPHATRPHARGSHSSTFQLNWSALYGIGDARRDCVARAQGVLGGV
jgi:hypothetical protein